MPAADPIELLLEGRYPDPETGQLLAAQSRAVVIEDSLDGAEAELIAALGTGRNVCVVSDPDTHAAMGKRVEHALESRFTVQSIVLGTRPHADAETVERVFARLERTTDLVVTVGAGTLNDISKMVALRHGCPQVVFATAPSMNGYTSLSASITTHGHKQSVRARTPVGVYIDLRVLAAAPVRLIRSGLGDSACRPTAQADWLISHLLLGRPYREVPFALLADDERHLFADPRALIAGDLAMMRRLARTLVLSGFGMTLCNGSFPASEGEHLLSHYIDMMRTRVEEPAFHGEQIAVCTLAMAELQESILRRDRLHLRPTTIDRAEVLAHFGERLGEGCWRELEPKVLDAARAEQLDAQLAREWDAIRARISSVAVPAAKLRDMLLEAGVPTTPRDLGWSNGLFSQAKTYARAIRDRYTFLDVAGDMA